MVSGMKSRRLNVPGDHNTILQCRSRTCTEEYSKTIIPHDLIIEIVSRLPTKSVARCRCVSKLWSSLLVHPYFTETYLTRSSANPKILFACVKDGKVFFFTLPQIDDDKANPITATASATYHMNFTSDHVIDIYSPMSGFVCIRYGRMQKGRKTTAMVWEICNSSTGQSFILPKIKSRRWTGVRSLFGYDPTEKQFKVLSMFVNNLMSSDHQVLTLATTGKPSVRTVECGIPHRPLPNGLCIDGVLYYKASIEHLSVVDGIICFDLRSETFRFVKIMEPFIRVATLINYKGKLALVMSAHCIDKNSRRFVMYVLQDVEKQEWSEHMYQFAPLLEYGVEMLFFAGVTVAGEIVLSPRDPFYPFYVFYCSLERKSIRRVEIQGMQEFNEVYTFVNHVEDVKLMQTF